MSRSDIRFNRAENFDPAMVNLAVDAAKMGNAGPPRTKKRLKVPDIPPKAFVLAVGALILISFAALILMLAGTISKPEEQKTLGCSGDRDCPDRVEYGCRNGDVYKYTTLGRCSGNSCEYEGAITSLYDNCGADKICVEGLLRCRPLEEVMPQLQTTTTSLQPKCTSKADCPPDRTEYDCDPDSNVVERSTKYLCALYSGSRCLSRNTTRIVDRCGAGKECRRGMPKCSDKTKLEDSGRDPWTP